jgi:indolepyruvate ferredoxin oxidoreductase
VAVTYTRECFLWGRRLPHDAAAVERLLPQEPAGAAGTQEQRLDELVARRSAMLEDYQDKRYAARYRALVERVARREREVGGGERLAGAVARHHFKLLAHKDEFEVGRLFAAREFRAELDRVFEGDYRLRFHLGGGPFARRNPATGKPEKSEVGPWVMAGFRALAGLRRLRGTWLDPFRRSPERRLARQLLDGYERDVETLLKELEGPRLDLAVELASWPEHVRGYAHVRTASAAAAELERAELWRRWNGGAERRLASASGA